MDKLVDGILLTGVREIYVEDFENIDPNYPTTDELDNMDSFLSHYTGFRDKVDGRLSPSDTITLYAIYISTMRD